MAKKLILVNLVACMIGFNIVTGPEAKCVPKGSGVCRACSNCKYCANCAENKGICTVCAKEKAAHKH